MTITTALTLTAEQTETSPAVAYAQPAEPRWRASLAAELARQRAVGVQPRHLVLQVIGMCEDTAALVPSLQRLSQLLDDEQVLLPTLGVLSEAATRQARLDAALRACVYVRRVLREALNAYAAGWERYGYSVWRNAVANTPPGGYRHGYPSPDPNPLVPPPGRWRQADWTSTLIVCIWVVRQVWRLTDLPASTRLQARPSGAARS